MLLVWVPCLKTNLHFSSTQEQNPSYSVFITYRYSLNDFVSGSQDCQRPQLTPIFPSNFPRKFLLCCAMVDHATAKDHATRCSVTDHLPQHFLALPYTAPHTDIKHAQLTSHIWRNQFFCFLSVSPTPPMLPEIL